MSFKKGAALTGSWFHPHDYEVSLRQMVSFLLGPILHCQYPKDQSPDSLAYTLPLYYLTLQLRIF